jgi:hypothetical protein
MGTEVRALDSDCRQQQRHRYPTSCFVGSVPTKPNTAVVVAVNSSRPPFGVFTVRLEGEGVEYQTSILIVSANEVDQRASLFRNSAFR